MPLHRCAVRRGALGTVHDRTPCRRRPAPRRAAETTPNGGRRRAASGGASSGRSMPSPGADPIATHGGTTHEGQRCTSAVNNQIVTSEIATPMPLANVGTLPTRSRGAFRAFSIGNRGGSPAAVVPRRASHGAKTGSGERERCERAAQSARRESDRRRAHAAESAITALTANHNEVVPRLASTIVGGMAR